MKYHNPVLLNESVAGLDILEDGIYVDVTFGGGGHSKEILKKLGHSGRLIAFDQDQDSIENKIEDNRFLLINKNFMYLKENLLSNNIGEVDGILADFGISSHQIDVPERGFSIRYDADLDMRMDQTKGITAADIINTYEERDLIYAIKTYGEERFARKIVKAIIEYRETTGPITMTLELAELIKNTVPKRDLKKNPALLDFPGLGTL